MGTYACKVVNWNAENGRSAWVRSSGSDGPDKTLESSSVPAYEGDYYWQGGDTGDCVWYQEITLESGLHTEIDTGTAEATASAYHNTATGDNDEGFLFLEAYDSGHVLLDSVANAYSEPDSWTLESVVLTLPSGTRYLRIGTNNNSVGTGNANNNFWDNFSLSIEGDFPAELLNIKVHQVGTYVWGTYDSEAARASQLGVYTQAASETSSGLYEIYAHQLGVYAWVRGKIDRRDLRAWPFTQDDHDFYVLQLGDVGTLVYDKLTEQWAQWRSPGFVYWRGNDGVQWEGWNICCDSESGKLWIIDPEGRLDEETTPIVSVVTGGLSSRMRRNIPCYMAELCVSEGQPPSGFDDGSVGLTLRTSDDGGQSYVSHGEIAGEGVGEDMTVRWYGLGLVSPSGKVFEITDTGYARRIDGLNVEVTED